MRSSNRNDESTRTPSSSGWSSRMQSRTMSIVSRAVSSSNGPMTELRSVLGLEVLALERNRPPNALRKADVTDTRSLVDCNFKYRLFRSRTGRKAMQCMSALGSSHSLPRTMGCIAQSILGSIMNRNRCAVRDYRMHFECAGATSLSRVDDSMPVACSVDRRFDDPNRVKIVVRRVYLFDF
ncbi:hypothetical protein BKA62DRAFT_721539, partial [Auriculariales sp. MPI-PUGE-AT-0066]